MTLRIRRDRLARALAITRLLSEAAQSRLSRADAQIAGIRAAERHSLLAQEWLAPALVHHLRRLALERREIEEATAPLRAKATELGRRARLNEKQLKTAEADLRQEETRKLSMRLFDGSASARGKSEDI
jgi:hypothetical protein